MEGLVLWLYYAVCVETTEPNRRGQHNPQAVTAQIKFHTS